MPAPFKAIIEEYEAEDIREFYDSTVFRVWHLYGKERTFRIIRVARITDQFRGEIKRKALLYLEDRNGPVELPFALNTTNREVIKGLYGKRPRDWIGRLITLFPTTCEVGPDIKDCIRIRNYDPETRRKGTGRAASFSMRQGMSGPPDHPYTNKQGVHVLPPAADPMHKGTAVHEQLAADLGNFSAALERNSTPTREAHEAELVDPDDLIDEAEVIT